MTLTHSLLFLLFISHGQDVKASRKHRRLEDVNLCTIDAPTIIISFSFLFIIIISGRIGRSFSPSPFFFVLHNFQYIYVKQLGIILAICSSAIIIKTSH